MNIWVVIPVYNEEKTVFKIIFEVKNYVKNILVVNDNSTDKTKTILEKLPVLILNNKRNLGYAKTLEKGLISAFQKNADYAITFDADGEHNATDLPKVLKIIEKYQPDLIIGNRSRKNRFMEHIFGIYSKICFGFSDPLCGFKVYKKDVFQKYGFLENVYTIATQFTFQAIKDGVNFKEVNINSEKRQDQARFANSLKGNLYELKALINIIKIIGIKKN